MRHKRLIFGDEIEWVKEETRFLDRLLPFFTKHFFLKLLAFIALLFLIARFFAVFITIIFVLSVSYIRFKREKMGLAIEIEPTYLFGIVLALSFGLWHGILFVFFPVAVTAVVRGLSIALFINIWNKLLVITGSYLFWQYSSNASYLVVVSVFLVLVTDIMSYRMRVKAGQPLYEILMVLSTNTIMRFIYLSMFLEPLVNMLIR